MFSKLFTPALLILVLASGVLAERIEVGTIDTDVAVTMQESNDTRILIRFDIGAFEREPVTIDGETFYTITCGHEARLMNEGEPQLPRISRSVIIPDDARMTVKVVSSEYVDYPETPVVPSKGNLLRTVNPADVPYRTGPVYYAGDWYPKTNTALRQPFILRDFRGTVVEVYPFQYNPASRTLRVFTSVTVEITNVGPGEVNVLNRNKRQNALVPDFDQIYQRRFINYDGAAKAYPEVMESGDMLIITYDAFHDAMMSLVNWKLQKGIKTDIVDVSSIGNTATNITNFIQDYYDADSTNLAWVLLVGDASQVATPSASGGASDPSYAKVSGSDSYPDIIVGRFSAENTTHVETQVERTIEYERDTYGTDWYHKATGIASAEGPGHQGEYDYEHMNYIRNDLLSFTYTQVDQIYDPGATAAQVSTAVNNGRSLINYCGHGSTTSWGTTDFSNTHANALVNDNMLPFVYSVACVNGNFQYSTCFAEAWMRATHSGEPTGAIATYMSSINQSWDPPMDAQDEATDLLIAKTKTTIGGICYNSACKMIELNGSGGVSMYNTWHIFGDPSTLLRTDNPAALTVNHAGAAFFVSEEYEVEVVGVEGALCAIYFDGVLYGAAYTGVDGVATIPITEELPIGEDVLLTVTAFNYETYVGTVTTTSDLAIIHRPPLEDTKDTLNDYAVNCTIYTSAPLIADSLLLKYQADDVWYLDTLEAVGTEGEYVGYIAAQNAGTDVSYYIVAANEGAFVDSTESFSFRVIDYAVTLDPAYAFQTAPVDDTVWYNLTVTNDGVLEDAYTLSFAGNTWPTTLWDEYGISEVTTTTSLFGDESFAFKVRVIIPFSWEDEFDSIGVVATSQANGSYSAVSALKTISAGQPLAIPFTDNFPADTFDMHKWEDVTTTEINQLGLNEPTPPYSINLNADPNGADTVTTEKINLRGAVNALVKYSYERTGDGESPEENDDLFVEYLDSLGSWSLLDQQIGFGPDMNQFEEVEIALPAEALHASFRLRLRCTGSAGPYDDWFVDDIYIGLPPDYAVVMIPTSQTQYGPAGDSAAFTITLFNRGVEPDGYDLSATDHDWDVAFYDQTGATQITATDPIAAGDSVLVMIKVAIPSSAIMNESDVATINAVSQGDPEASCFGYITTYSAGLPGSFPWYEPFPDDTIATVRWIFNSGAQISTDGLNPPSGPYSLNLDGGNDTIMTQPINLDGVESAILSYYYQCGGGGDAPESNDDLLIQYKDRFGDWVTARTHKGGVAAMSTFEQIYVGLALDAIHSGFQIRFISNGSGDNIDDWFVDDIRIDYAPAITVTPGTMQQWLAPGDSVVEEMYISNTGQGNLTYSVTSVPLVSRGIFDNLLSMDQVEPARRVYPDGFHDYDDVKGIDDPRVGLPVTRDAGGPDLFGYYWIDSDISGGPAFAWDDISATGVEVADELDDDNFFGPIPLGFDFPFYNETYSEFYIGSNGIIGFDTTNMKSRYKKWIPNDTAPNAIIAWMWDDLDPTDSDNADRKVYYDTTGGHCVIMFENYSEYGAYAGDVITAEVILEPDGTITIQYLSIASGFDIGSSTVGIESPDGTDGLEVAYLTEYVHDGLAVRFFMPYQWLSLDHDSGILAAGEIDTLQCTFRTGELDNGDYSANVIVTSNDPDPTDNPWTVPAQLTVNDSPQYVCGDANGDELVNMLDLLYIIDYLYTEGPVPPEPDAADVDSSGACDLLDILAIIDFLYVEGADDLNCP